MMGKAQRIALVTGASSGIGRACAAALSDAGFRVYGTSRSPQTPVQEIDWLCMDVDRDASVRESIASVLAESGRIDVVVNCAGFGIGGSVEDSSGEEVHSLFETNVFGLLRVCQAVLPVMRSQRSGTLINMSSIGGRIALPFQGIYSATKYAVEGLTESLRMEVRGFGINVVLVEPGDFATGFTDRRVLVRASKQNSAYADAFSRALKVVEADERGGATPEIIGRLVVRIAETRSPRLRYTVGPVFQRVAVRLKSMLPARVFEWGLRTYYKIR